MKRLADGLFQLSAFPPDAINTYLLEDVLVDAATRYSARGILRQLKGVPVVAHALTHAHPDHQGSSRRVCETLGIPFWVGEADADAAEDPSLIPQRQANHIATRLFHRAFVGPGYPVDRRLQEGDQVGGFQVLHVPGHSAGHIAFWREADRALVVGDVLTNMDQLTLRRGLHEPKPYLTPDPALNRQSARRLAELEPALVCFGHGAPLRDTKRFVAFGRGL
jgi:hydroxyacylglutathione hydrolase